MVRICGSAWGEESVHVNLAASRQLQIEADGAHDVEVKRFGQQA
jgi:hypothetical protein